MSNDFDDRHFWFTTGLGDVNWNKVLQVNLPFLNEEQNDVVLTIAMVYSINPIIVAAYLLIQHRHFNFRHNKEDVKSFATKLATEIRQLEGYFEQYGQKKKIEKDTISAQAIYDTLEKDETNFQSFLILIEYA